MLSDFLDFTFNVVVAFMPLFTLTVTIIFPFYFIGSVPHLVKKITFFWK